MLITADREAHDYVSALVKLASGEIGGIGYVQLVDKGHFHVSEFVLLDQEASWASVEFDSDSYIQEITRAAEEGRENELRLSWHSHGNLDTYWSGTDEEGIKEYRALGMPWLVSLVFNKDGNYEARLDIFDHETADQIKLLDMDYEVESIDEAIIEKAEEDIKKLVKKPKTWKSAYQSGYQGGYRSNSGKSSSEKDKPVDRPSYEDDDDQTEKTIVIPQLPHWLEINDFMNPDRYAILEMEYGSVIVEAWEDEMFDDQGFDSTDWFDADEVIESTAKEDDDELRILTP